MNPFFWQSYPLLRFAIFFLTGLFVGDAVSGLPVTVPLILLIVSTLIACLTLSRRFVCSAFIYLAAFALGMTRIGISEQHLQTRSSQLISEEEQRHTAVVTSKPGIHGKVVMVDLLLLDDDEPTKVKASVYRDEHGYADSLKIGDGLVFYSAIEAPKNFYQSNFDYVRWLHCHGYVATTFIYKDNWTSEALPLNHVSTLEKARWRMLAVRDSMINRYRSLSLEGSEEDVVAAMTLGDKSGLSKDLMDAYSIAGGSHVLALSGLHLTIVYAFLLLLLPSARLRWLSQVVSLTAIWAYVFLVGMMPSVVRSAVMLTVYGLLSLTYRSRISANVLAFTAIVMLLFNPLTLWDVGFEMSFIACLFICICYSPLYHLWKLRHKAAKELWGLVCVSLSAQIGTAPLVAYYFGRFSTYFLLTDFIVVPLATLILYTAFVALLTAPLRPVAHILGTVLAFLALLLNKGVQWVASLPGSSIDNIQINTIQLALIYVAIGSLLIVFIQYVALPRIKTRTPFDKH